MDTKPDNTINRRIAAGLCPSCGVPNTTGTYSCDDCREKSRTRNRDRQTRIRESRMAACLCIVCGGARTDERVTCQTCIDKYGPGIARRTRDRAQRAKQAGLCVTCAAEPAEAGHTRCAACAEARRPGEAQRARKTRELRIAAGSCGTCGGPKESEARECDGCAVKRSAAGASTASAARRVADGKCRYCTQPALPESDQCAHHWVNKILHTRVGATAGNALTPIMLTKFQQQEGKCFYTGVPIAMGSTASMDHVWPTSRFPLLVAEPANLVWAASHINYMKRDALPDELLVIARAIIERADKIVAKHAEVAGLLQATLPPPAPPLPWTPPAL